LGLVLGFLRGHLCFAFEECYEFGIGKVGQCEDVAQLRFAGIAEKNID
jgi:hypothetical protein